MRSRALHLFFIGLLLMACSQSGQGPEPQTAARLLESSPEGKDFSSLLQEGTAIYNLQGQRMSSLRKGLNIVNGRKDYVK